jgi:hypothetical protein
MLNAAGSNHPVARMKELRFRIVGYTFSGLPVSKNERTAELCNRDRRREHSDRQFDLLRTIQLLGVRAKQTRRVLAEAGKKRRSDSPDGTASRAG